MITFDTKPRTDARSDEVRWTRRPVLAWTARLGLLTTPFIVSVVFAWSLTVLSPQPSGLVAAVCRWLAIASLSSAVLVALEKFARRLLPIAALLDLTLAFPDQAPSRFKVALRTGSTGQLAQRIAEVRSEAVVDPSISAAQRVIELVAALSVHDRITRGHSERVRAYTQMIADEMGLPEDERERLRWAGLLHDVGKLLVPTSILNKDGRLTAEEYEIVKSHPENGRRIVAELVPWLGESARAVWEHHEKWDGSGYPHGLAGEEISLAARIVAVADVYDVMTSARSYKDPVSPKEARSELARCAGSHFDPVVVRAFLNISLGRVRRAAGPLSWLAQLTLFPTAVVGSTQAAGSAVVLTGALSVSTAGAGAEFATDTSRDIDPREVMSWAGEGIVAAASTPDDLAIDQRDPIVVVTLPPTVIVESSWTANDPAIEAMQIVVGRPLITATADLVRPGADGGGSDTAPPKPAPLSSPVPDPVATATAIALITTIPPATSGTGVANPAPPTTISTGVSVPTTTVPTTTVPTATVPTTTVPTTTGPTTTGSGTTVPPTTLPQVEPPPTTPPTGTQPVALPNGKPRPVNAGPSTLPPAGAKRAPSSAADAQPTPGPDREAGGAAARAAERATPPKRT